MAAVVWQDKYVATLGSDSYRITSQIRGNLSLKRYGNPEPSKKKIKTSGRV